MAATDRPSDSDPWRDAPTLVGHRVLLRPLRDDDCDALIALSSDREHWDGFIEILPTAATAGEWMDRASSERASGRAMPFMVCERGCGAAIGTTRFMRMNAKHRRVEIGTTFYVASVRRSGVNTETKRLLLGYAFDQLRCNVVQIRVDVLHHRSRRAIEKLGAQLDGIIRRHSVTAGDRVRDLALYSVIAGEWPGVRAYLDHAIADVGSVRDGDERSQA